MVANYTLILTPKHGFAAAINYSILGLPQGATATLNNSILSIPTSTNTPPGTNLITLIAASGTLTHSTSMELRLYPDSISPPPFPPEAQMVRMIWSAILRSIPWVASPMRSPFQSPASRHMSKLPLCR